MKLFLMRHADALPKKPKQEDPERPLSPLGKQEAKKAGKSLLSRKISFDAIFSSPYLRAMQTATIVAKELGLEDVVFPEPLLASGCEFGDVMEVLDHYPDSETILMVGHEPDFGEIAAQFLGKDEPTPLAKAQIVEIDI